MHSSYISIRRNWTINEWGIFSAQHVRSYNILCGIKYSEAFFQYIHRGVWHILFNHLHYSHISLSGYGDCESSFLLGFVSVSQLPLTVDHFCTAFHLTSHTLLNYGERSSQFNVLKIQNMVI